MPEESSNDHKKPMNKSNKPFTVPVSVVGVVILILLSPWIIYLTTFQTETNNEHLELEHSIQEALDNLKNEILTNATEFVQVNSYYNVNSSIFAKQLNKNLQYLLASNFQPYIGENQDIETTILSCEIEVKPLFRTTYDLFRYPQMSSEEDTNLETFVAGLYYDVTVPFSYQLICDASLSSRQLKIGADRTDPDNWKSVNRKLTFEAIPSLPHLFIEYKLQQFQNQGTTAFSDLGRMIKYMLTTMARIRVYNSYEAGYTGSYLNVLNEGDVEVALNLALLLEEALLFRAFDTAAVDAIDHFYYYAMDEQRHLGEVAWAQDNPTGKRVLGTSEKNNYIGYTSRRSLINDPENRLLATLIEKYVTSGLIDPADLMALYYILDKEQKPAQIGSAKDTVSILEQPYDTHYLMDPKTVGNPEDTTNLKFILPLPNDYDEVKKFNFSNHASDPWEYYPLELLVDQQPNYLVAGADFKVENLYNPKAWYSTAILRQGTRGRTPPVPPPDKPGEHDYRVEWNLRIQGSFELNLRNNAGDNFWGDDHRWQNKVINIDLPINIYVWLNGDPGNDALTFHDLNDLKPIPDAWVVTTEATMVEYFEVRLWRYLKPLVALGFDEIYSILPYIIAGEGLSWYTEKEKRYLNNILPGSNIYSSNWISDILLFQARGLKIKLNEILSNFWKRFDVFMELYFIDYLDQYNLTELTTEPQFPHPPLKPWINVLGHDVKLSYNNDINVMNFSFEHSLGSFDLLVEGYNTSVEQLIVILKNRIELPGLINLETTTTSRSSGKPETFASGELFNNYPFNTQVYSRPNVLTFPPTGATEIPQTNEQFLLTRAKFGQFGPRITLELTEQTLGPLIDDASIKCTFILPADQGNLKTGLEDIISTIDFDLEEIQEDNYIQYRIYVSGIFRELSEELILWIKTIENTPKLAVDISLQVPNQADISNVTFFLSDTKTTMNFFNWLGEYGLRLVIVLSKPESLLNNLPGLLTKNNHFEETDYDNLDIEVYARGIRNELLEGMDIKEIIQDYYGIPNPNQQNLTVLLSLSGNAIKTMADGVVVENQMGDEKSIKTFIQIFYCYQLVNDEYHNTYLLLGVNNYLQF